MDNSWMSLSRVTIEYQKALEEFLDIMFSNEGSNEQSHRKEKLCTYARVREELKESSSGREPSRMDLFVACFSKDGIAKNVEAANAIKQMRELHSQLPEGSVDEPGTEDIFSKVMGKDKDGRARMYGLGVRASDVWGLVPSRPACYRETMQWKAAYEGISGEVAELKAMVLEMRGSNQNASCASSVPVTSTHRPKVATKHPTLQVGFEVYLKSIINTMEIVAKARVKSLDPDELVGGEELGPNWCEAHILVAIKKRERLVRPYGLFVTIEDAIGATIAWHCPFISVVPEDET